MIKLKDLLSEGKWKFKGKYLTMPGGEISSIPRRNEKDRQTEYGKYVEKERRI